jgi:hypothetical protein
MNICTYSVEIPTRCSFVIEFIIPRLQAYATKQPENEDTTVEET